VKVAYQLVGLMEKEIKELMLQLDFPANFLKEMHQGPDKERWEQRRCI